MTDEQWDAAHEKGWEFAQRMVDAGREELIAGSTSEMVEALLSGFWDKLFDLSGGGAYD